MDKLARFSVAMEVDLLERFDALVASRGNRINRSEAIRDLVRDALVEDMLENPEAEVAGTITMIFDHHASDLTERLTSIQHQYTREIVSTLHVHLDVDQCLEVIVLRGAGQRIHAIAHALLGIKGIRHGKLVTTTINGVVTMPGMPDSHQHPSGWSHDHANLAGESEG